MLRQRQPEGKKKKKRTLHSNRRETLEIIEKELKMPENTRTIQDLLNHLTLQPNNEENVLVPILTSSTTSKTSKPRTTALKATKLKTPRKRSVKHQNMD